MNAGSNPFLDWLASWERGLEHGSLEEVVSNPESAGGMYLPDWSKATTRFAKSCPPGGSRRPRWAWRSGRSPLRWSARL